MPDAIDRIARDFSPRIQRCGADAVVLDVSGLGRLLGSPQMIGDELARHASALPYSDVRVAIAPTQTAALLLTLSDGDLTVVTAAESAALAPLPLQCLQQHVAALQGTTIFRRDRVTPADDDFAVLRRWGLKTLGEFAALPASDLSARMGQQGLALQRLARGVDPGPLVPDPGVPRFIERMELEWPIDALEPLSFVLARLLEPLADRLERADRGAAVLYTSLRLTSRTVFTRTLQLPAPMRDPKTLRTLILLDLESHPPDAPIDIVRILIEPTPAKVLQWTLLDRAQPAVEQVSTLVARLTALMGEGHVGSPVLVDTWRPGAFTMSDFRSQIDDQLKKVDRTIDDRTSAIDQRSQISHLRSALRRFRFPIPTRVVVQEGRPIRVQMDRQGFTSGAIVQAAGPWRTSGNWWSPSRPEAGTAGDAWDRDEWDVSMTDGTVYRLVVEREVGQWFLEGVVD
jgi:protein ImuB